MAPATDDHPFPYLPNASLPGAYLRMLGLILAGAALLVRLGGGRFRSMRSYVDLAFMGAAFLLLETKNIVQFALLFGTTWFVNALVFAGVLVAVYLAVETARWVRLPRPAVLYAALIAALAAGLAGAAGVAAGPADGAALPGGQRAGVRPVTSSTRPDQQRSEAIRVGCHASPSRCVLLVRDRGRDNHIIPA